MSGLHKPISDWVARLDPSTPGHIGLINDGDERLDARTLPLFDTVWTRTTAVVSDTTTALALRHESTGTTVVELDDYGNPLQVDDRGADLVSRMEESWPDIQLADDDLAVLQQMSKELRYLLLHRLEREGQPRAGWFHVLPWEPVIELAAATVALLAGNEPPELSAAARDLGHWVTPAVSGVTGPLEQLHDGLAADAADPALIGATALCAGILEADPLRLPDMLRTELVQLLEQVAALNPFLRHSAKVAAQHLGLSGSSSVRYTARLHSEMPKAASQSENRSQVEELRDGGPLSIRAEVTAGGRLHVTAEVTIEDGEQRAGLIGQYTMVAVPVVVRAEDMNARYWIALEERRRWMAGTVTVPRPLGRFQVEADGPPVGIWGLATVTAGELLSSIKATNNAGRQVWTAMATRCATTHPLVAAVRRFGEEDRA